MAIRKEEIGQSAAKLLWGNPGEGSTTRIYHLKALLMMMKSVGETVSISTEDPKCPTPYRKGEDIVWSFMKVNVRTMAKEMMEQTKNSILSQAAQAMLAQANQQPQGVLQLLR